MALDSSEESMGDSSEWPPGVRMPLPTHKVDHSHPGFKAGKRPYCNGGRQRQPRWLGIGPPSSESTSSSQDVGPAQKHSQQVRGSRTPSDAANAVLQQFSERPEKPSASCPEALKPLRGLSPGMFSKAFGMLVRDLQNLSINAHKLKDLHWKEMENHASDNHSGGELAVLLEKLGIIGNDDNNTNLLQPSSRTAGNSANRISGDSANRISGDLHLRSSTDSKPSSSQKSSAGPEAKLSRKQKSGHVSRRVSMSTIPSRLSSMEIKLRDTWLEFDDAENPRPLLRLSSVDLSNSLVLQKHGLKPKKVSRFSDRMTEDRMVRRLSDERPDRGPVKFLLHPHGTVRLIWNLCCLMLILYDIVVIPLEAFNLSSSAFFRQMEWVVASLWTLDILVSFRTGYTKHGSVVLNPRRIAIQYAQSWFAADLLIVALEWFARFSGEFLGFGNLLRLRCISSLHVVKTFRLTKMKATWRSIESKFNSNLLLLLLGMCKMTLALLMMIHFITCIWYAIGESSPDGWTSYYEPFKHKDALFWYFASTRWTLAQINGRTDIDPRRTQTELWYTCSVAVIFAIIFMSIFVSSITSTMVELSAAAEAEASTGRLLDIYLGYYKVDKALIETAKRYLRDRLRMDDENSEANLLGRLPRQLANDLICEIHQPTLVNNAYFNDLAQEHPRVLSKMCSGESGVTSNIQVHKWEMLFDVGDVCSRLVFVERGLVIYSDDVEYTTTQPWSPNYQDPDAQPPPGTSLWRGSWVSESALWMEWLTHGRCVAAKRSTLLVLDAYMFGEFIRDYKDLHERACFYAKLFVETLLLQEKRSDIFVFQIQYTDSTDTDSLRISAMATARTQ